MVKITGYTEGFLPISVVRAIRTGTGVGLAEGKALMESIVDGRDVILTPADGVSDQALLDVMRAAGVEGEVMRKCE
ncbi:hypothetical protein [Enhygromyxa salina]|uniref:hypothetical protein n=1 Tax=Enhygromyxa salina TaxID=215803 RepID=UPI0011B21C53|nr:hypothetical protein [Enhygromyxa salina]